MSERAAWVYILECADKTLYTGWTYNAELRLAVHNAGRGAKYTRPRLPVRMVYREAVASKSAALKREYALKQLTHVQKWELIVKSEGQFKKEAQLTTD